MQQRLFVLKWSRLYHKRCQRDDHSTHQLLIASLSSSLLINSSEGVIACPRQDAEDSQSADTTVRKILRRTCVAGLGIQVHPGNGGGYEPGALTWPAASPLNIARGESLLME